MDIRVTPSVTIPDHELTFRFTRSGGPGGQNVNKVSTKVELIFNIPLATCLSQEEKERILSRIGARVDAKGFLRVSSQESRSQWKNREIVIQKFTELLRRALAVTKKRKASRPTAASKASRVQKKLEHGKKKKLRRPVRSTED